MTKEIGNVRVDEEDLRRIDLAVRKRGLRLLEGTEEGGRELELG